MKARILDSVHDTLRAVATTVVPEAQVLDAAGWQELRDVVEGAIATRSPDMQRQLVTFLRVIEYLPLARYGSRFSRLSSAKRVAVLLGLQESPIAILRRGMWGLRTLVFMGYYTRADVATAIGYRASAQGWSARRSGLTPSSGNPVPDFRVPSPGSS